jgi:hypothetical protein
MDRREADDVVLHDHVRLDVKISRSRSSTYRAPSHSALQVGSMNSANCSIVGLRKTGAVSRMKSFQNWPGPLTGRRQSRRPLLEALRFEVPATTPRHEDDPVSSLA